MLIKLKTLIVSIITILLLSSCQQFSFFAANDLPNHVKQDPNYLQLIQYFKQNAATPKQAKTFTKLHNTNLMLIAHNYVLPPNFSDLNMKALQAAHNIKAPSNLEDAYDDIFEGLSEGLDLHTDWLTKHNLKQLNERISGEYVGIGAIVAAHEEGVKLQRLYTNGGAFEVGLKKGDIITNVDNQSLKGKDLDEIVALLKGREKTFANIKVKRANKSLHFKVPRRKVHIEIVTSRLLQHNIGYITLDSFNGDSDKDLLSHIKKMRTQGADKLILDLRGNPGGLLPEAIKVADIFLDKNKNVVSITARNRRLLSNHKTQKKDLSGGIPLIVLIDEASASASEIVAGALKDHQKATIIGRRSFGKGTVQQVMPVQNLGALKLTYALYESPKGGNIQGFGIVPHIIVKPDANGHEIIRSEDIKGSLIPDNQRQDQAVKTLEHNACPKQNNNEENDPILNCAVQYFTQKNQK